MFCRTKLLQVPLLARTLTTAQISRGHGRNGSLIAAATGMALAGLIYYAKSSGELEARSPKSAGLQREGNLYIWGNNGHQLIFESQEKAVPLAKRISFFDGTVFRDLALGRDHAAAVDAEGNVLQWGSRYFGGVGGQPEKTLKGMDIIQVKCGASFTYALSKKGEVFILGKKGDPTQRAPTAIAKGSDLKNERIISIDVGEHHIVAISERGKVLTAAQDELGNSFGQLGLSHREPVPAHEWRAVKSLEKEEIKQVACGSNHTLLLTKDSLVFGFGANNFLQLATGQYKAEQVTVDIPLRLSILSKREADRKVTQVGAGADTSFFIVDGPNSSELMTCGTGLNGQLGTGRFVHMEGNPSVVEELSNHKYFDEMHKKVLPIRIKSLSFGEKHAAAVLDTKTAVDDEEGDSVFIWGWNQDHQLGNGTKAISPKPIPAKPVQASEEGHEILKLSLNHGKLQQKIICGDDTTAVFTVTRK